MSTSLVDFYAIGYYIDARSRLSSKIGASWAATPFFELTPVKEIEHGN